VELAPSVHTVGDGGHAARARDAGSGPADVTPWNFQFQDVSRENNKTTIFS
jgi:hypothetical protein